MIESPASADVVVKLPATNTKIAHGLVSIDHNTKVFSTVFHPFLDQEGLIFWEIQHIPGYIFLPIDWKNRLAPSTKVSFEHNRIPPRGPLFVHAGLQAERSLKDNAFRMANSHSMKEMNLPGLALEIEPSLQAWKPVFCMLSNAPICPRRDMRRQ
jgi:hypothetical protein